MTVPPPALLLIDIQWGFDDPAWGARNNPDAEARMAELLAAWREAGARVIHVHHDSPAPEGRMRAGTEGHAPKPSTAPRAGEAVYVKRVNSAFIGTSLERDLRAQGVDRLVIAGLTTNHCISTTARMAGNLGFKTVVTHDATATFDRLGLDGRLRPAAEVHAGALSDIAEEFCEVIDTREAIRRLHCA